MLDVHVLTLPGLPEEWIKQRRDSIDAAVSAAGFPVYVHEVDGIDGHLGKSRRKGYAEGAQPYVTHVDHDDWVREDAFAILLPHMEAGARAITTGEVQVMSGGSEVPAHDARHHLAVFERSWLWRQQFDRMKHFPDQYLLKVAGDSEHISEGVYFHRISEGSASRRARAADKDGALDEMRMLKRPDLLVAESMTKEQVSEALDAE